MNLWKMVNRRLKRHKVCNKNDSWRHLQDEGLQMLDSVFDLRLVQSMPRLRCCAAVTQAKAYATKYQLATGFLHLRRFSWRLNVVLWKYFISGVNLHFTPGIRRKWISRIAYTPISSKMLWNMICSSFQFRPSEGVNSHFHSGERPK